MNCLTMGKTDHLSFLRARDPSILSGNLVMRRENIRTNLALEDLEESAVDNENGTNIQIHLRIKKADNIDELYKIDNNEIQCSLPPSASHSNVKDVESVTKKYTFSCIFPPNSTQEDIFNSVVKPKVFKFINGGNATLMSYGASGSGKTFTIVGTVAEPGIIPRTLEYLFRTLPELPDTPVVKPTQHGNVDILSMASRQEEIRIRNDLLELARNTIDEQHTKTYREMQNRLSTEPVGILEDLTNVYLTVWVSFSEIYNESIYDLLTPVQKLKTNSRPKLKLAAFNENTYIRNLTNVSISSGIEAYQILQYGLHNLNYASTSINSHSSRSHCIFTIKIAQVVKGSTVSKLNYFNFCDLAGSERLKKTLNVGDRLKESNNINTSLLVLGRCISCIRENQKRSTNKIIPYRESKLTRLFQRALSGTGNESISMIVNMNPCKTMFEESLHVLNFSAIAKDIVVKRAPVKTKTRNRFSDCLQSRSTAYTEPREHLEESAIMKLQDIIDKLYLELEQLTKYCVEQESRIREEVIQQQSALIEGIKQRYQERISAQEARHREHVEALRNLYRNSAEESEVINLDSSTEEEDVNETNELRAQVNKLTGQVIALKSELLQKTVQIDRKDKEINELREAKDKEINELRATIADAKVTYIEMQRSYEEELNDLVNQTYDLRELNSDLRKELNEYSKIMCSEEEEETENETEEEKENGLF